MTLQYGFGAGTLISIPTVTHPTPTQFGALQGVEIDFDFTTKELYSSNQYPIALARGTAKITGKASNAQIDTRVYNDIFFNQPVAAQNGQTIMALGEAGSVPASSTYTITVTHSATFVEDLGVKYAATGIALVNVASLTAAGQYTYSSGVYTFYSGDASANVLISYSYTVTSGKTLTITNQLLGSAAYFEANLQCTFQGNVFSMILYRCMSSKLTFPFKLEDFMMNDFEFAAFANDAGNVGIITAAN